MIQEEFYLTTHLVIRLWTWLRTTEIMGYGYQLATSDRLYVPMHRHDSM